MAVFPRNRDKDVAPTSPAELTIRTGDVSETLTRIGVPVEMTDHLYGDTVSLAQLDRDRGINQPPKLIAGYSQLTTEGVGFTQFLTALSGAISAHTLIEKPRHQEDITERSFFALHADLAPGKVSAMIESASNIHNKRLNTISEVSSMYMLFRRTFNSNKRPFLANIDQEAFGEAGVLEYQDTLSSADAEPRTGWVNVSMSDGVETVDTAALIDDENIFPKPNILAHLSREDRAKRLDTLALTVARQFGEADGYDYQKDKNLSIEDKEFIEQYFAIHHDHPLGIVACMRAAMEIKSVREHQKANSGREGSNAGVSDSDRVLSELRLDKIRDEIEQGIDIATTLDMFAALGANTGANPVRVKFDLVDNLTIQCLQMLVQEPEFAIASMQLLQSYNQLGMTDFGGLVITSTNPNPHMLPKTSLRIKPVQGPEGFMFLCQPGQQLPSTASQAVFLPEIVLGFADPDQPNYMHGDLGNWTFKGPYMVEGKPESFRIIDAMEAPACFMKRALALGALVTPLQGSRGRTADPHPTIEDILSSPSGPPELYIVESTDEGLVPHGKVTYDETGKNSAVEFVRNHLGKVVLRAGNIVRDEDVSKDKSKHFRYRVELQPPLGPEEVSLGGVAIFRDERQKEPTINYHVKSVPAAGGGVQVGRNNMARLEKIIASYGPKKSDDSEATTNSSGSKWGRRGR